MKTIKKKIIDIFDSFTSAVDDGFGGVRENKNVNILKIIRFFLA